MNELLLILAISVIIIGFLILVGVAIWLAMERRRLTTTSQQRASQPAAQPKPAPPAPAATPPKAATTSATTEDKKSDTPPKEPAHHKDVLSSGEYPSAALYDQTLLPQPPKKRTKPQPK